VPERCCMSWPERGRMSYTMGYPEPYISGVYTGVFGREITKYTVMYGVYSRFWPILRIRCTYGALALILHTRHCIPTARFYSTWSLQFSRLIVSSENALRVVIQKIDITSNRQLSRLPRNTTCFQFPGTLGTATADM